MKKVIFVCLIVGNIFGSEKESRIRRRYERHVSRINRQNAYDSRDVVLSYICSLFNRNENTRNRHLDAFLFERPHLFSFFKREIGERNELKKPCLCFRLYLFFIFESKTRESLMEFKELFMLKGDKWFVKNLEELSSFIVFPLVEYLMTFMPEHSVNYHNSFEVIKKSGLNTIIKEGVFSDAALRLDTGNFQELEEQKFLLLKYIGSCIAAWIREKNMSSLYSARIYNTTLDTYLEGLQLESLLGVSSSTRVIPCVIAKGKLFLNDCSKR